jgi:hypothetical protein
MARGRLPGESVSGQHRVGSQGGDVATWRRGDVATRRRGGSGEGRSVRAVARGVGGDQATDAVGIAADEVLRDFAAQAEPHWDDRFDGQLVQQRECVVHCGAEVETAGRDAVAAQVGRDDVESIPQRID